jgi:hypothetical protein
VFEGLFNCPDAEPYIDGEDIEQYESRYRLQIQECASSYDYPMIARIWDIYEEFSYSNDETQRLLGACQKLRSTTDYPGALWARDKLILACHEALKQDSGLFLASD